MPDNKDVEQYTPQQDPMMAVIERAVMDPGVDVEKMSKLLDIQERIMDRNAESAFNAAMVRAQNRMRPVMKDAANEHTRSMYARLETIDKQIRPIYTSEGFSMSFGTDDSPREGMIRILCDVSHSDGHVRHYKADIPLDMYGAKGNQTKTATHAFGSTISYGQRYLTKMIFNLAIANEDDDGNAASPNIARTVTPFQSGIIKKTLEIAPAAVLEWFVAQYADPSNVPRHEYNELMNYLNTCINNGVEKNDET